MILFLEYFFAIFYGAVVGNLATTMYYRIPRGKPINGVGIQSGLKPHCSKCGHELRYYEYLPVLSWVSAPIACNYCGAEKDKAYTFIEVFGIAAAILLVSLHSLNIMLIVDVFLIVNALLTVMFYVKDKRFYMKNIGLLSISIMLRIVFLNEV